MSITVSSSPEQVKQRLAGLDHLRAVAIIIVFFWHYNQSGGPAWIGGIAGFGWTGVDLFFVLSGYLIGGQLLSKVAKDKPISFREFYFKRFFRIIPAYLVVLILYFTIPGFKERGELSPLWKFLTFTQNFGLDLTHYAAFSHAWSLCIEEQFYFLLPLIVMAFVAWKVGKKAVYFFIALFVAGFVIRGYIWMHSIQPYFADPEKEGMGVAWTKLIYYPTYCRLDGLLAGVGIAALFHFKPLLWQRITKHGNILFLLSLLLLTIAYLLCMDRLSFHATVFGFPMVAIAYGTMVLAALSPSCVLYRYNSKITAVIATLAYSVYLTHKQIIHLVELALAKTSIDINSNTMFVICIAISLLAGLILHLIIEKPFLKMRDNLINKKKI